MINEGMSLEEIVAAKPNADTDEALGGRFINPEQFVGFIYSSLTEPPESHGRP